MHSPVRLGLSPAAASTPTGVFNQGFEALFPRAGALGCAVCYAPHRSSWFICARMWGYGVLPATLPAPFSATLSLALSVYLCANVGPQGLLVVRLPACSSHTLPVSVPPLLRVWMNISFLIYLVSDFLAFRFSVSSGCARRRSVSTYAAILVLPNPH